VAGPTQQHRRPSCDPRIVPAPRAGPAVDVIELILADHRRIRRLRNALCDAVPYSDDHSPGWVLASVWQRTAGLLEAHCRAEEEICYLSMFSSGPHATELRREAIADHDDIREALGEASVSCVGSAQWWRAVRAALAVSADHVDREERGVLADWQLRLTMSQRREFGRQWSAFIAAWTQDATPSARSGLAGGAATNLPLPGRQRRHRNLRSVPPEYRLRGLIEHAEMAAAADWKG
jgi:hypothetical protein